MTKKRFVQLTSICIFSLKSEQNESRTQREENEAFNLSEVEKCGIYRIIKFSVLEM